MRIPHVTSPYLPKYGTDELARFVRAWRTSNWAFEGKSTRLEGIEARYEAGANPRRGSLVPVAGFEPATPRLRSGCSTN